MRDLLRFIVMQVKSLYTSISFTEDSSKSDRELVCSDIDHRVKVHCFIKEVQINNLFCCIEKTILVEII